LACWALSAVPVLPDTEAELLQCAYSVEKGHQARGDSSSAKIDLSDRPRIADLDNGKGQRTLEKAPQNMPGDFFNRICPMQSS